MMSRKNYRDAADSFGLLLREHDSYNRPERREGVFDAMGIMEDVFSADNPRFDRERFRTWVREVREHGLGRGKAGR